MITVYKEHWILICLLFIFMINDYPIVSIRTKDGLELNGLLLKPRKPSKKIIMHIHGTSGCFYWNKFYEPIYKMAYAHNIAFLSTNNRGSGTYELEIGTVPHGASLEKFEDCIYDIDAWIKFCLEKGYSEIILIGHSFGTEKSVYYMEKGGYQKNIKALILLGFSDNVGTQQKYEKKIGKNYLKEAKQLIKEGKKEHLLSDLRGLAGELPISAQTYKNFFSKRSENSKALPLRKWKDLMYYRNIKIPILGVISDNEEGEYTIIPIKEAIELLRNENRLAEIYQIKGTNHGFEGKEVELVKIIAKFIERRVFE